MKRITFLFALLCASVMGWATQYCGEALASTVGATTGQTVEFTASKTGELETTFSITSATSTIVGLYEAVLQNNGGGVLAGEWNNNSGWTLEGNTLSKVVAWTTYPTGNIQLHLIVRRDNSGGDSDIMGRTFTDVDVSAACGSTPASFDPTSVDWTSSENTTTYHKINDQFQIAAENAANMPTGPLNIQQPAWAAFEGIYIEVPAGVSACAFNDVAVTDGDEFDGNTGAGIVLNPAALTNEITKVTVTHGLGTTTFYVHNANAGGSDPEPTEIYDVNFALQSEGGVASAKSGNDAGLANNGNTGDRWWSETAEMTDAEKNDQWWQVDLGQRRIFNTIQIVWEGAWGKSFDIQISDDGSAWTTVKEIRDQTIGGPFPYTQTIELDVNKTAQYVRFQGIERGTGYAYSFWEFRVLLAGTPVLTSIELTSPATIAQTGGAGVVLTAVPKDQNGNVMSEAVSYEITPAAAGHMSGNTFIPDQAGTASIRAYNGSVYSNAVQIIGVPSANLALSTNISTDNKIIAQSDFTPNGTDAFHAVDGNMGSVWQGSPTNGNVDDSREYDCWFVVDLGAFYNIDLVALHFEGACSELYHIDFSANNTDWNLGYNLVGAEGINARNDYWTELDNNTKVRYVRFWSTKAATGWGMKLYEFEVYGTEWSSGDEEKPVMVSASLVSSTTTSAVIAVEATDNDVVARYHVVDGTKGIDANFTPSDGKITINGLTHNTAYNFTITAKDASNNESANSKEVEVTTPFDVTINLALNQPCEAGYENTNPAESRDKANDGNDGTNWNTFADRPASEEWWYVDLGEIYNLTNITALWGDVFSTKYLLQARVAAPSAADKANDEAWVTLATVTDAAANAEKSTNVSGVGRYIRIHSLTKSANFFRLRELRVFGSGVAPVDTEAPVMTSASLVSNTDVQAVIAVAATDNQGIANYHVVDAGNSFNANFVAEAGNITVTGLTGGTNYNLVITAVDYFGNESANSESVEVNTTAHYIEPQTAAPVPTWPEDQVKSLYSNTYAFAPASLNSYNEPWWSWPAMTEGDVDGNTYLHYNLAADGMIGWQFAEISVTSMEKLHIDIFSSGSGTLTIRPITTGGPEVRKTLTLVGQQWNSFDIALSEFPGHDWSKLFQFAIENWNAGGLTGEHISVDNVYFYRTTPPPADEEAPTAVTVNSTVASYTSATIKAQANDDSGVVHFKVLNGSDVLVADVEVASGAEATIVVNALAPSTAYNLSLIAYDEAGHEAEPVAVAFSTLSTPAAAPQPTHNAMYVLSVYSNAYEPAVAASFNRTNWGSAPLALEADYMLYTMSSNVIIWGNNDGNAGHGNIDGLSGHTYDANTGLDISGMNYIHFDVWCDAADQLNTVNINDQAIAIPSTRTVAGEWVSFDVAIGNVPLADRQNLRWLKFHPFNTANCVAAIDNVYFWKAPDLVRDDDWMAPGELGTICIPNGAVAEGGDIYQLVGKNSEGKIVFSTVDNNQMAPGVPYLFEAKSNAMKFYYTAEDAVGAPVNTGAMKGTFDDLSLPDDDPDMADLSDIYYFAGRALWSCADISTLSIPANRAYVKLSEVENIGSAAPAPGRRYIIMGVNGENQAQGFENLESGDAPKKVVIEGTLYILRGEKVYDATGRLVK